MENEEVKECMNTENFAATRNDFFSLGLRLFEQMLLNEHMTGED